MPTFAILLMLLSLTITQIHTNSDNRISVKILAITNTYQSNNDGVQNTGGHWLAIQQINNDTDFLPQYVFQLIVLDAQQDSQEALKQALQVTEYFEYKSNATHIYFPLIIGAPWSTLSTSISPILGIKQMGSISCASTSVVLSNTKKYPYFYRTIPTDALQVNGIIELCYQFGWRKIAVVYVSDAYGSYFSLGIQELSKKNKSDPIDVTSIAISNHEPQTYNHAATQIKQSNIYVIVIVSHSASKLFDTFKTEGILDYPYYIIGTDGWFNTATINNWATNFSVATVNDLQGFIGTVPWGPDSWTAQDLHKYPSYIRSTVNKSQSILNEILRLWKIEEDNGNYDNLHTNASKVLNTMIYGYDAMFVIAKVIEKMGNITDAMISTINRIITQELDFIGASGRVAFNTNGDSTYELYSIGNTLANGTVSVFGFFYQNNGTLKLEMDVNKMQWPTKWGKVVPRLDIVLQDQIITIDTSVSASIFACLCISLLIAFIFMVLICYYRKNMIIIHASWKLNVSMSIGAILLYVGAVLYGIDESYIFEQDNSGQYELTIFCNLRLWMTNISCTLLFMPLFLKTYRLSHIFKKVLVKTVFTDEQLFVYTGICIIVDIILLTLFTILPGLKRDYYIAEQWMWMGTCSFAENVSPKLNWLFFAVVILWKLCELTFGIYCGLIVSRIQDGTNILRRYDETGMQLLSCFVISSAILIFVFGENDIETNQKPNFDYVVISITILLIGNFVLFFNLFPRIFAVITGNDKKFIISPEKRMEDKIRKQLERYRDASSVHTPSRSTAMMKITSLTNTLNTLDTTCADEEDNTIQHIGTGGLAVNR